MVSRILGLCHIGSGNLLVATVHGPKQSEHDKRFSVWIEMDFEHSQNRRATVYAGRQFLSWCNIISLYLQVSLCCAVYPPFLSFCSSVRALALT